LKQKFELEHEIELDQIKQKGSTGSQVTKEILHYNKNKGIRVSQLAKIPTLFPDWWRMRSLN
jgi:hypothetical protein